MTSHDRVYQRAYHWKSFRNSTTVLVQEIQCACFKPRAQYLQLPEEQNRSLTELVRSSRKLD